MIVIRHILISLVFSSVLFPFVGWYSVLVFFSGFLIDVDHWLCYLVISKDFGLNTLKRCEAFYLKIAKRKDFSTLHRFYLVFHSLEFVLLLTVISFFVPWAIYVLLGVLVHLILDYISMLQTYGAIKVYSLPSYFHYRKFARN